MKNWILKARTRLRSQAGESIGETLVSLLVAALALTMLAGAVSSAGRIVTLSRNKLNSYYSSANSVAQMSGTSTSGSVTITGDSIASAGETHNINMYSNSEQFGNIQVAAYKLSNS